jgi:hypothetical protein
MNLNHDFRLRAVQHAAGATWTPSPLPGVTRRMLDRVGDEVARDQHRALRRRFAL